MYKHSYIALFIIALLFSGCGTEENKNEDLLKATPEAASFNAENNRFGLEMFKQLNKRKTSEQNIVVSPVSAAMASGMTFNGTAGETRQELARVLGWNNLSEEDINQYHRRLIHYYNNQTEDISLNIANAIWHSSTVDVFPDFLRTNKEYFSAFHDSFENPSFVREVNQWAQQATDGNIDKIMESSSPEALLYIINATYFRGDWKHEFNASKTTDTYFYLEDGTRKRTQMMWQKADLNYYRNGSFQMVELPYENESFSMYILLPDSTMSLNRLISNIDFEAWEHHKSQLSRKRNINFGMPRFRCEYSVGMKELMEGMGVKNLFEDGLADLSGISEQPLSISQVMHKAAIDVDEKGTEATATTSLARSFTTLVDDNPFNLVVNRPFVFAIEEKQSGSLLFMGKISNP